MRVVNDWTIIDEFSENGRLRYHVVCKCGSHETRRKDHVESGRTKSCKSCSASATLVNHPNGFFGPRPHSGVGDLGLTYWGSLKHGALRRGLDFSVTPDYAWSLFDGTCALSGVPINLSPSIKGCSPDYGAFTASLDRVDSSIGYVEGNIQWVHKEINMLKGNLPEDAFKLWCKLVTDYCKEKECSESTSTNTTQNEA